jgi:hypothetical protein
MRDKGRIERINPIVKGPRSGNYREIVSGRARDEIAGLASTFVPVYWIMGRFIQTSPWQYGLLTIQEQGMTKWNVIVVPWPDARCWLS